MSGGGGQQGRGRGPGRGRRGAGSRVRVAAGEGKAAAAEVSPPPCWLTRGPQSAAGRGAGTQRQVMGVLPPRLSAAPRTQVSSCRPLPLIPS